MTATDSSQLLERLRTEMATRHGWVCHPVMMQTIEGKAPRAMVRQWMQEMYYYTRAQTVLLFNLGAHLPLEGDQVVAGKPIRTWLVEALMIEQGLDPGGLSEPHYESFKKAAIALGQSEEGVVKGEPLPSTLALIHGRFGLIRNKPFYVGMVGQFFASEGAFKYAPMGKLAKALQEYYKLRPEDCLVLLHPRAVAMETDHVDFAEELIRLYGGTEEGARHSAEVCRGYWSLWWGFFDGVFQS